MADQFPEAPMGFSLHSYREGQSITSREIQFDRLDGLVSTPVITALASSPDGRFLAAAGDDHSIRIIDIQSGEAVQTVIGHDDWIQSMVFSQFSSNEGEVSSSTVTYLYSAGHDGRILRWGFTFPLIAEEVAILPFAVRSISVSTERRLMAIGGFSDEVLLYDLAEDRYIKRLKCSSTDQRCVRFSPDGSRVLSGSREGEVCVWSSDTGELIARYREHQSRIHAAVFSADGSHITSAGEDRKIVCFHLDEKRVAWSREMALSKMMALHLINEDLIAVAGGDNRVRLFDAVSNSVIAELAGHQGTIAAITVCDDFLATGSFDTTVRFWNLSELERARSQNSIPTSTTPIEIDNQLRIR
jgi:WD40 repeat protein